MNDSISRQDAIDALDSIGSLDTDADREYARGIFNALPSAEPERKRGNWRKSYADHEAFGIRPFFRYCSECHEATVYPYNFCPNCGADMRGEKDE